MRFWHNISVILGSKLGTEYQQAALLLKIEIRRCPSTSPLTGQAMRKTTRTTPSLYLAGEHPAEREHPGRTGDLKERSIVAICCAG